MGALSARIAAVKQPGDIAGLARELASIPLPVRLEERSRHYRPPVHSGEDEQRPVSAVGICRLDGALVTNAHLLRSDEIHDLGLELRLTEWPEHATAIEVTFLSVLSPSQARLPSFTSTRTSPDDDGVYRLSATGSLSVSFTLPAGAPPAFPVAARFTGSGLDEVLPVAGHNELRLRPFDATTDALTSRPQLDERIVAMYSVLHAMGLNADDVQAFCRLYTAIVDKAVDLLSGPGGLASFLRRRQLGARLGGPSLPLDIGYAETVPAGICNAVTLRDQHCRCPGGYFL